MRERKAPEWLGLLCLAVLSTSITSLLSVGFKQAMLNDSIGQESKGKMRSFAQRIRNATNAFGTAAHDIIHSQHHRRGSEKRRVTVVTSNTQGGTAHSALNVKPLSNEHVVNKRDRSITHATTTPPQNMKSQKKNTDTQRRILAIGGSTTWGAKLDSRLEAYPAVLSTLMGPGWETVNVAIRATGAALPSQCIQTMVRDAVSEDHDFDIILMEYSLNGLQNLLYLAKRLRRRYPKALIVYVDLYALRMNIHDSVTQAKPRDILKQGLPPREADEAISKLILETPQSNWVWSEPMVNYVKRVYLEALDVVGKVGGFMYGFPMPQTPAEALQWFGHDFHHLSTAGHRHVALGVLRLIQSLKNEHSPKCRFSLKDCDGTWGKGDICFSWFETGKTPHLLIEGGKMLEFAPNKYALHVGGKHDHKAKLSFENPSGESQPIEISYMSWRDPSFYPRFKVTLTDKTGSMTSKIVDPTNPEPSQRIYHITVSTPLGWVKPGWNSMTIEPNDTSEVPARLIGIIMCGACAEMNYTSAG